MCIAALSAPVVVNNITYYSLAAVFAFEIEFRRVRGGIFVFVFISPVFRPTAMLGRCVYNIYKYTYTHTYTYYNNIRIGRR